MDEVSTAKKIVKMLEKEYGLNVESDARDDIIIELTKAFERFSGNDIVVGVSEKRMYNPHRVSQQLRTLATKIESGVVTPRRSIAKIRELADKIKEKK
jgi:hypothetical protein